MALVSTVCKRLEYNAQRLFPHRLKLWKDISDNVTTSRFLLSKIGRFLTEVEVCNDSKKGISVETTMELLDENCKNLEKIHLHHSIPSNLFTLPSNIRSIAIKFPENWTLSMGFLEGLKNFSQLESLTLKFYHFTQIDSGFLTELPPLKQLRLKNCSLTPMDLQQCLEKSKSSLEALTLSKCFPEFPNIIIESIDQLVKLNELEFQFNCGPADFVPLSIFNRLTSLKLTNAATSIDANQLFGVLIEHNKIQTLSMNSIDTKLNRMTMQQLHRLTSLRRLNLCETDFVTDAFLTEISKSKNLTHFTYKQTYQPMLSLVAVLAFVALNGPKLHKCSYIVYHDITRMDTKSEEKKELMAAYRKTVGFKRIHQCREDISHKLTSVEFLFKQINV